MSDSKQAQLPIHSTEEILKLHDLALTDGSSESEKVSMLALFDKTKSRIAVLTTAERIKEGSNAQNLANQRIKLLDGIKTYWQSYFNEGIKDELSTKEA